MFRNITIKNSAHETFVHVNGNLHNNSQNDPCNIYIAHNCSKKLNVHCYDLRA